MPARPASGRARRAPGARAQRLDGLAPAFLEVRRHLDEAGLVGQPTERTSAVQIQRPNQERPRAGEVAELLDSDGLVDEPVEEVEVDQFGVDVEDVAAITERDHLRS